MRRLAIICSHPIQYYAPWFAHIAQEADLSIKVFYLHDSGIQERLDPEFEQSFQWDVSLLEGYESEFVPNHSSQPGTDRFFGLRNPALSARVREFDPQAVLMFGYNSYTYLSFLWQWRRSKVPLLFRGDSHLLGRRSSWKENIKRIVLSSIFRNFSGFLCVGSANKEYFLRYGAAEEQIFLAPHAVDNERFMQGKEQVQGEAAEWRAEIGIPADDLLVLFAGKLVEKKRPQDLVKAFQIANVPATSLLIVGSGPLEASLRKMAAQSDNIYFAPFQNQSSMPRTYASADLFILPSLGAYETWGLAINEAMCLGCAIGVSSHVGCGQDLVRSGENGFIFEAGNEDQLAVLLSQVLGDSDKLKGWGQESQRIIKDFSYVSATAGLKQALEHALR